MWKLSMINGPKMGEQFELKQGDNTIGRSPGCNIVIPSSGISKSHCNIHVKGNALRISDIGSSNGTYINGLKIQDSILQVGDRVSIHDVIVEIQYHIPAFNHNDVYASPANNLGGSAAEDLMYEANQEGFSQASATDSMNTEDPDKEIAPPKTFEESVHHYLENILMPGIYKLGKLMEFKTLLFSFILLFIFIVTALSVIPMLKITQDSIEKESSRRAISIARSLVNVNQSAMRSGFQSQLSTRFAEKEEGVKVALIISAADGSVLAPANQIGSYKKEEFIHKARKIDEEYTEKIQSHLIGASVPIRSYDPNTGNYDIKAYAMVLYNMGSLAIDDGRTLSLFIQTLLLALTLGGILFYFMYKLIERPYYHLVKNLDEVIAGDKQSVEPEFHFPALQKLHTNLNSILNQSLENQGSSAQSFESQSDAQFEAENIVRIIELPAFTIDKNNSILSLNLAAENLMMESSAQLVSQNFQALNDASLKLSLQDLIDRMQAQTHLIQTNELEFNGVEMEIDGQAFKDKSEIKFFLFCIKTKTGGF